jgi:hypothetical protein
MEPLEKIIFGIMNESKITTDYSHGHLKTNVGISQTVIGTSMHHRQA